MTAVYVSIGNSDGKLSHAEWAAFYRAADELLTETVATQVYGRWHSLPATPYVNACWAVEIPDVHIEVFKGVLAELARAFRQESIAYLSGQTEFIGAGFTGPPDVDAPTHRCRPSEAVPERCSLCGEPVPLSNQGSPQ